MKRIKYFALAALVAFAACDEADEVVTPPPVTGSISGVVSIEGAGASGVTVTLSSGASATTDGSGAYAFSGVAAGSYTVSISGFPSDAAFATTAKAATISTAGQVATVSFDGSYVRTSAIFGSVAAGGMGLEGVNVSIGSASTSTDANGQFSFTGLRAGTYTVSISGVPAGYSFGTTSQAVTVGVGESKAASFSGTLLTTASISGRLFLDENNKDDVFTPSLEANLSVAGVEIMIEGGAVLDTMTTLTDADGMYSFTGLAAGTYRLFVDDASPALPGNVAFGEAANNKTIVVGTGGSGTLNWAFDIVVQTVKVYGYLGTDGVAPGQTPIKGWDISLYDTQANAVKGLTGTANGEIAKVKTDANGEAAFRFNRSADVSPNSSVSDLVVFAKAKGPGLRGAPSASHTMSGETIIEIKYSAVDSMQLAPDTLDALYGTLVVKLHAQEIDADTLAGWNYRSILGDTANALLAAGATDADGDVYYTFTPTGALPDTFYFRMSGTQAGAGGHSFNRTPVADRGTVQGSWLRFIWDGTVASTDTVMVGMTQISYNDMDVTFGVHHEVDDSTDTPTYTAGDSFNRVQFVSLQAYKSGFGTDSVLTPATPAAAGTGVVTFLNVPTNVSYDVHARRTISRITVLNDTVLSFTPDGSDQTYTDATLKGGAGNSSFAIKSNNNTVSGSVLARDGVTGVKDVIVTLAPTADNIQGTATKVDTTGASGAYSFTGILEGPYTVTVADIAGMWQFFDTLKTTSAPTISGGVNNTSAHVGTRDVEGDLQTFTANFQPHIMNTKIQGTILNDRDGDGNTVDAGEQLTGATVELYGDTDGDGTIDTGETVVATTTTDANGAYEFADLKEGDYIVKASAETAQVTRAMTAAGVHTTTAAVTTTSTPAGGAAPADGGNNRARVGTLNPAANNAMPFWDYDTDAASLVSKTHFTFLQKGIGIIQGEVFDNATGLVGQQGVQVILTRCFNVGVGGAVSPPAEPAAVCTKIPGTQTITNADANGAYSFTGLDEGVYQIEVFPSSIGLTTVNQPSLGAGVYHATIQQSSSVTDTETVPDFLIS